MTTPIKIPDVGVTVDTVIVHRWLVHEGAEISRGQPIAELEADKAIVTLESAAAGVLLKIVAVEGAQASVGDVIAFVGDPAETVPPGVDSGAAEAPHPHTEAAAPLPLPSHPVSKPRVTPMLRNLARQKGVDIDRVVGTGQGGLVTREDILAAAARPTDTGGPPRPLAEGAAGAPDGHGLRPPLPAETLIGFYRGMLLIRILEERIGYLFLEGVIPGTLHQSLGQEAVAVGVCSALRTDDVITSGHRPHGHALAKGVDATAFVLELLGKPGGCCGGKGGSMHVGDLAVGMIPSIAIVGANLPVGTGAGLAFKLRQEPRVAVCFTGDGGVAEGAFHEAVNLAAVWNLPVVYVIENNQYAASTHYSRNTKLKSLADLAAAYGIPGVSIDGNDVVKVYATTGEAVERARRGEGPTIVEAMTYRLTGHNRRDPRNYMPLEERQQAEANEPIGRLESDLIAKGLLTPQGAAEIRREIDQLVEQSVQTALTAAEANPDDAFTDVFA